MRSPGDHFLEQSLVVAMISAMVPDDHPHGDGDECCGDERDDVDFEVGDGRDEDEGDGQVESFGFQVGDAFLDDDHVAAGVLDAGFDLLDELVDGIVSVEVGGFEADGEP